MQYLNLKYLQIKKKWRLIWLTAQPRVSLSSFSVLSTCLSNRCSCYRDAAKTLIQLSKDGHCGSSEPSPRRSFVFSLQSLQRHGWRTITGIGVACASPFMSRSAYHSLSCNGIGSFHFGPHASSLTASSHSLRAMLSRVRGQGWDALVCLAVNRRRVRRLRLAGGTRNKSLSNKSYGALWNQIA